MPLRLYEHQNIALPILLRMEKEGRGGILADACGLGKTITMATHLMINKIPNKKDLIVCPLSLMVQWEREIQRVYKEGGKAKPNILFFHGNHRVGKFSKKKWDFVITTYSIMGNGELNRKRWGRVVLDESHNIRNGLQSKKSKCSVAAFQIGKRSIYNWCMSATPFCNRVKDIASQCKFIGTYPYNDPKWWKRNGKNTEEVVEWRQKFVLRRTKENILAPPKYYDIEVTPTQGESALVDKIRTEAQEKFEMWKRSKGLNRITLQGQILGLIQRLRVVSNSFYCGEKDIDTHKVLHENAKVREMLEVLDRTIYKDPTNSVIIFSQFTSYLDILEKVIDEKMVGIEVMKFTGDMSSDERDEVVDDFINSLHPRVLLISLTAGGCGLNLLPCSTVFIAEPYYNPFLEKQAEERVHRLGQTNQVNVYRFSVTNSVETWVNGLKKKKLYLASGLDLICKYDKAPTEFCFNDLSDLFTDLVGFKNDERYERRQRMKQPKGIGHSNRIPNSPKVKLGIVCSVCTEDVGNKNVYNLACGHLYHRRCLNPWLLESDTCPMCREQVYILS